MQKLKNGFRKFFLIVTVFSLMFASCRHPAEEQNDSKTENITITVTKGSHVKNAAENFTLQKGSKLGFSALKEKIKPLEFDANYELSKITVGTETGTEITNATPYTFNENTTIFISATLKGMPSKPKLTELKVDEKPIDISDVMDAGKTNKDKIKIEAKSSSADATIVYEPALDKDNFWKLEVGKKSLKIKVKKGSDEKEYTLNVERLESGTPMLTKITVGEKSKEGAEIAEEMNFTASQDATSIDVKVETEPKDAPISFNPTLTDGKLTLSGDETTLTITVGTAPKTSTYTVKVKKLVKPINLINALFIAGGKLQGVQPQASKALREKILNGDKDVVLELNGTFAEITAGSSQKKWKYFRINGENLEFFSAAQIGLVSASFADIPLLEKGQMIDVKIEVGDEKDEAELNFKIKRLNETVDVPVDNLIIAGRSAITDPQAFIKLADGSKPKFTGYEPTLIEIQSKNNVLKKVTINDSSEKVKSKNDGTKKIWYVEKKLEGIEPQGKDVTIVIEPEDTENYHPITWEFHLNYQASIPMTLEYKINGKDMYDLDPSFNAGINNNTNPLIEVNGNFLNLKLSCGARIKSVKINENTIECENIKADGEFYNVLHSEPINTSEKNIDITITPYHEGTYSTKKLKFRVKTNGNAESMAPYFAEISGDKNLPKTTFKDKLTDGSNPLHQIYGNLAKMVITFTEYEADFLCKEVKIDNEKFTIKKTVDPLGILVTYKVEKTISVSETTPKNVKIEFIANEGKADSLTWSFQLQGGGTLPSIPQNRMRKFTINGVGWINNPLPKEFTDHLTDGKNPLYKFDGKRATVELGCYDAKLIEKIEFMIDGEKKTDVVPKKQGYVYSSTYTFEINDLDEHLIKLTAYPQDTATYSPLIYTFKLQRTGNKVPIEPITIRLGGVIQKSGYKATLKAESVIISVEAESNIIAEVTIGEKEKDEQNCPVEEKILVTGKKIWEAQRDVSLLDDDGNAIQKTFRIIVKPIDTESYREATCEYIIKGTKIPKDNAEFVLTNKKVPDIRSINDWIPSLESNLSDDYGVKAVKLTAYTVSPKAKVMYQIIDLDDKAIEGFPEKEMTNNKGTHTSEKITMFENKPTRIKLYVIAEDGHTTNDKKGVWKFTYNPVPLTYGYENHEKGAKYTTKAYDTIEIDKTQIGADKKIYLIFAPWNEKSGYSILNSGLPSFQTDCVKLEALGKYQQYYKTSIDVSTLISEPPTQTELEAVFKLQKKGIECIHYKVKIKVKS